MDLLFSTPFVIRVLISLAIILVVNKYSRQLSLSILAGVLVLALWSGHSPSGAAFIAWKKLSSANLIFLMIIVCQVIWLSIQMSETGVMKDLVSYVQSRTSQRLSMALLPAVIGLLPMPGGAAFSAPLVADCDASGSQPSLLKTQINYWFRHVWEYWWPLYPGVLLAIDITGLTIPQFMLLLMPMTLIAFVTGYFFLLRKVKSRPEDTAAATKTTGTSFLSLVLPILIVITMYAGLKLAWPRVGQINKYLPLVLGIITAQSVLQLQRPLDLSVWKKILFSKTTLQIAIAVALVLVYGNFIDAELPDGSLLVGRMREELSAWGIPLLLVIMLIPFISGLTTGLAIGYVGASFPIVISLIGPDPGLRELMSITLLAYASGYAGMLLSPVHICLILTNQYFKTSLFQSLLKLAPPAFTALAAAGMLFLVIR